MDACADDSDIASLVKMLRFHGMVVDPEHLAHRAARVRFGVVEIVRRARDHNLKAQTRRARVGQLLRLALPAINRKPKGAFQILAKVVDDKVLLHDPVNGRRQS